MNKDNLETYLLALGKLALMINILSEEQRQYIRQGILTDDEIELAETIKYQCKKLHIKIDDQVRLVASRTEKTWDETLVELKKMIAEEEKNG